MSNATSVLVEFRVSGSMSAIGNGLIVVIPVILLAVIWMGYISCRIFRWRGALGVDRIPEGNGRAIWVNRPGVPGLIGHERSTSPNGGARRPQ